RRAAGERRAKARGVSVRDQRNETFPSLELIRVHPKPADVARLESPVLRVEVRELAEAAIGRVLGHPAWENLDAPHVVASASRLVVAGDGAAEEELAPPL